MDTPAPKGDLSTPPVLGDGPPTMEEIACYYPPMFSWDTVKSQVDSGDLGNLLRHPVLQKRYEKWSKGIAEKHGSMVKYLVNVKLQWAPTESRPPSPGSHARPTYTDENGRSTPNPADELPTPPPTRPFTPHTTLHHDPPPTYFTADISPKYVKILKNDWPYSVPLDVEHYVFWTRVPIIHPDIVSPKIWKKIEFDGLWGFTGDPKRVEQPKELDMDDETRELLKRAHRESHEFVLANWPESSWETAWFVNPPRLQSIPGLAHGHVFARRKSPGEI